MGFSLEKLATKVGISPITLQRIETAKSSPSLVLLSESANNLNKFILSFVEETGTQNLLNFTQTKKSTFKDRFREGI
jgi:transcriptional regulator with XRE-family HTH domain